MQKAMIDLIINLSLFTLIVLIFYIFEIIVFNIFSKAIEFAKYIDITFNQKINKVGF